MLNIFFSVVIPFYNTPEKYISRAVNSLESGDFHEFEIIIIDDGSCSEYGACLDKFSTLYENVRIYHFTNGGSSVARNIGVKLAKGRYVAFVDADDFVTEYFLKNAYMLAKETNADFIIGGTRILENKKFACMSDRTSYVRKEVYKGNQVVDLKRKFISGDRRIEFDKIYIGRGPWARVLKRELAEKVMFDPSLRISQDHVWNLQILGMCDSVVIAYEQWYWYWQNLDSTTHKFNENIYEYCMKHLEEVKNFVDLSDPAIFDAYVELVNEDITMIWECLLRYRKIQHERRISIKKSIMEEKPWVLLRDRGFVSRAKGKYKLITIFYRTGMLFFFLLIRDIYKSIKLGMTKILKI